jgi:hypothetical protein
MACLAAATQLRQLRLHDCYGVSAAAVLCSLGAGLRSLALDGVAFGPEAAAEPQQGQEQQLAPEQALLQAAPVAAGLAALELANCPFLSDAHLAQVVRLCPRLERLCLDGCPEVSDAGVAEARRLPRLRQLLLAGCQVDGSFAGLLAALPALSEVRVAGSELLGDEGCLALAGLPLLRAAGVAGCLEVGSRGLALLLALPHLRELDASGCSAALLPELLAAVPEHMRVVHDASPAAAAAAPLALLQ